MEKVRANILVRGIVQGVGFRPYIHKQITGLGLSGWIRNDSRGVELELEGDRSAVDRLLLTLKNDPPRLALIESAETRFYPDLRGYEGFRIIPSRTLGMRSTLISPDTGICADCLRELFDPGDRRFRYPFINCTNCGPRFTIIRDVPYDRPNTTMAPFAMCPQCAAEYGDISDRRYHAQPDCCGVCGPRLFYLDGDGRPTEGDALANALACIHAGGIVAVKGLGGIHLACRSDESAVVDELRRRKHRDAKPFALMCRDLAAAERYCVVSEAEAQQLRNRSRPIVLLEKREPGSLAHISENGWLGVMLPYTPVHHLLLSDGPDTLVMTSANLSDMPILYKNDEAIRALHGIADGFLLNDRDIETRCDDSLLWVVDDKPYFVRRSRGYVPHPITVAHAGEDLLAAGAEQKASFTLFKGAHAFPSQHIGDLKNLETFEAYERQIDHFQRLFDVQPRRIVCDLHPDYLSTAYAEERAAREELELLRVQHHHAHMAACMADNGLEGECIGVIWDGTGLGPDGTIWGGEFLTGGYGEYSRPAAIRALRLPGGDKAVREPWRLGVALLTDAGLSGAELFDPVRTAAVETLLRGGLNCPVSSSVGRLFDGVSAILGLADTASYEGQGAVRLEAAAAPGIHAVYPYEIRREDGMLRFDYREMIRAIVFGRREGVPAGELAAGFMNTLVAMAAETVCRLREDTGLDRVVLSGGSFQNIYMLRRLTEELRRRDFAVFRHCAVSANDEGLSLGQGLIASRGGEKYVPCHSA